MNIEKEIEKQIVLLKPDISQEILEVATKAACSVFLYAHNACDGNIDNMYNTFKVLHLALRDYNKE